MSTERVTVLRDTWRQSSEHLAEQAFRFLRLMMFASVVPLVDLLVKAKTGGTFDWETVLVAIVPVFEGVYRQLFPALGAAKADSAPGTVTTVGGDDGLEHVPEPVNTDNGPRSEDGPQDEVSQDPNVVPEGIDDPFDDLDAVEEGS